MKKGIKVLLVYPNPAMDNLIPVGVSLLSACLKQAGHQVKLFDTTFYESGKEIGEHLRERNLQVLKTDLGKKGIIRIHRDVCEDFKNVVDEYQPDLIGVSVFEISYLQGLSLLKKIKDYPIPKIMGGIHATFSPDEILNEDCVDMVCIGEGEDALVELADCIRDRKDYDNVKNLWVKKNGKIIKNEVRELKDINMLPFQDWEIYDKKRLYKPFLGDIVATAGIQTSRGCIGKCTFCCNPYLQNIYDGKGRFFRKREIEKVIAEIKYFKEKYDIGFIKFVDADFLAKSRREFLKFAELYKTLKIPFWAEARADTVTEEKVKLLEEIGCKGFAIGIESGNLYIRNEVMKKCVSQEQIERAIKILQSTNMRICTNIMIGMPFETREMIFDTISFLRRLKITNPVVNIFNPYRGTYLHDVCVKKGYLPKGYLAGDYRGECVLNMPQLSKEEILGLQRTFPMYVNFPKKMWPSIELAESSDEKFEQLSKIYTEKYLNKKEGEQDEVAINEESFFMEIED